MNFLLSISPSDYSSKIIETYGFGETFLFGGQMLLIGLATVFAVLIIIMLALVLFKVFFHDIPKNKKAKPTPINEPRPEIKPIPVINEDETVIAVIAAAIAAAESENTGVKFRVVSFRKK